MKNKGEFGFEHQNGLGDLPEELYREQSHVPDLSKISRTDSQRIDSLADLVWQHQERVKPKQLGTVPYSGEVISTYDSRPINASDFSGTSLETFTLTAVATDATTVTATYMVPGGFVGVLKGYRYEMKPLVPIDYDDLLLDILVDNVPQLGYRSLMHGQVLKDFIPCFILADDSNTIDLKLRAPNGINSVIPDVRKVIIELHGNLLQTTGAPLPLEISNKEILPFRSQFQPSNNASKNYRNSAAYQSLRRSIAKRILPYK